jgi:predicted acylesterase/phospholipase RssA
MDLILSSGFLAFARHLGAIEGVLGCGVTIDALVGTSSGALVGAFVQAGLQPREVARLLTEKSPLSYLRPHARPWQGLCSLSQLRSVLGSYLPKTFEDLRRPFAVGVRDELGQHSLLYSGDLVTAVLASIAIPRVFPSVERNGKRYSDGGMADRTGVDAWRVWRPNAEAIVHIVDRTHGKDVASRARGTSVVRTPRSHASFWSLGDFAAQQAQAREIVRRQLSRHR